MRGCPSPASPSTRSAAAVHVHAIVRLDGPAGPTDEPPGWGTADRLTDAVRAAASRVSVRTPYSPAVGELALRWGAQVDARPLRADGDGPDDDAVAAYVAKYVTKGASETGAGTDHRVTTWDDIEAARSPTTYAPSCAPAGASAACPSTSPCACAPGPTPSATGATSSPSPAPTRPLTRPCAPNAPNTRAPTRRPDTVTDAHWRYVGSGHTPGAALIAAGIARRPGVNREISREEITPKGGGGPLTSVDRRAGEIPPPRPSL